MKIKLKNILKKASLFILCIKYVYSSINSDKDLISEILNNPIRIVLSIAFPAITLFVGQEYNEYIKKKIYIKKIDDYIKNLFIKFDDKDFFINTEDVSNLENVIKKAFEKGAPINHILISGSSGSGKTFCIKLIAKKNKFELINLDRMVFQDIFCIEGENISHLFFMQKLEKLIEKKNNIIIFLDELDLIALSKKHMFYKDQEQKFNNLLLFLQNMSLKGVLVVAATNKSIDEFDNAITRTQRFGKHINFKNKLNEENKKELISIFLDDFIKSKKIKLEDAALEDIAKEEIKNTYFEHIKNDEDITISKIQDDVFDLLYSFKNNHAPK